MDNLKRLFSYSIKYIKFIILGYVLLLFSITLAMINPYISKLIIDKAIPEKTYSLFAVLLGSMLFISITRGIIRYSHSWIFEKVSQNILFDFRERLYHFLQNQSYEFYDKNKTGELMARMTGDLEGIRRFFANGLPMLFENLFYFIVALTIMFSLSINLTLAVLIATPLLFLGAYFFDKTIRPEFMKIREKYSKLNSATQENITGVRVVKAYSQEEYEIEKFTVANEEYKEQNIIVGLIWGKYFPILEIITSIISIIIFLYGGSMVIKNKVSLGTLIAFQGYLSMIIMPLRSVGMAINIIERANISSERVFGLLWTPIKIKSKDTPFKVEKGKIEFSNVYFKHFGNDILKNINITIQPNTKIAFMGPTGAGKSSIINLIPRFYDAYKGKVLVDDIDVREYNLYTLRNAISIIPQETFLFSDTIANNIAYGNPKASLEEIIEAAKVAQAHDFIMELPNGYNTLVGERGIGLSGGQKQRVAIARALLKKSKIMILDDATSAVDMETEYLIQKGLDEYLKDSTVIIIAHRISSVKNCDMIYYIENGEIIEKGTHEQLLAMKGKYYNIYIEQYKEYNLNKEGDDSWQQSKK